MTDLNFLPSAATELSNLIYAIYADTSVGYIVIPIVIIGILRLGIPLVLRSA